MGSVGIAREGQPAVDPVWQVVGLGERRRPRSFRVKPGLAALWQVSGRSALTYAQRRDLDLTLARNRSLRTYLEVLLRTIPVVLQGANSW